VAESLVEKKVLGKHSIREQLKQAFDMLYIGRPGNLQRKMFGKEVMGRKTLLQKF